MDPPGLVCPAGFARRSHFQSALQPLLCIVEGQHDVEFLRRISAMLHRADSSLPDLGVLERTGQLVFIPCGGGNVLAWADRFAALRCPEFHLFDREIPPETDARRAAVARVNMRPGCRAFLTTQRTLEDYLHPMAIQRAGGGVVEFLEDQLVARGVARQWFERTAPNHTWSQLSRRAQLRFTNRANPTPTTTTIPRVTPTTTPNSTRKAYRSPTKSRRRPTLRFSPTAWAKLLFLRDLGDTEVGGFGITRTDDLLYIEDVVLVKQTCSSVTVAFEDDAVAEFFDRQIDAGRRPEQFGRIWIHTHPGDCANPSSVDEETFARVFARSDWAVMVIVACGGQTYARLRFHVGPGGSLLLPLAVDYRRPFAASQHDEWTDEYITCVHLEPFHSYSARFDDWNSSSCSSSVDPSSRVSSSRITTAKTPPIPSHHPRSPAPSLAGVTPPCLLDKNSTPPP